VVLTSDAEGDSGAATSFALPDSEMKVRIDQYGYAKLVRPVRSNQHVDPLSNLVDGAADMEREAALSVCAHLNEHVEAMAQPQRWTPSPDHQLVPMSVRPFAETSPEMPRPIGEKNGKHVYDPQAMHDTSRPRLDEAAFVGRLAEELQEHGQRAAGVHRGCAGAGLPQGHSVCAASSASTSMTNAVRMDVQLPLLPTLGPEAAIDYGNRVAVRRMSMIHTKLHNRHASGWRCG
jgi:hypothetical protein